MLISLIRNGGLTGIANTVESRRQFLGCDSGIGNSVGFSYDDGLFRSAGHADSLLQKPIQLSVTPRIADCRVSERPLLSLQICGPATPHRPYLPVDGGR